MIIYGQIRQDDKNYRFKVGVAYNWFLEKAIVFKDVASKFDR